MQKTLPHICPSCGSGLMVKTLLCATCHTEVTGAFDLPLLASLTIREQDFILEFVKSSGSLKIMAQKLDLSYPTVRNLLDDIILKLESNQNSQKANKK